MAIRYRYPLAIGLLGTLAAGILTLSGPVAGAQDATVIELTQIPCQFIESENGVDRGFTTTRKADCEAINARTGAARLAEAKAIELKAGKYIFRVTNRSVPYDLGFWLREQDYNWKNPLHQLTKISISGGGLSLGTTRDYAVELTPGEYLYSCPLNTTPDYRLVVTE